MHPMSLQAWLIVHAIMSLVFGLLLVFVPKVLADQFSVNLDKAGEMFARLSGGGILFLALINWASKDYTDSAIIWAIVGANIVFHLIGGGLDLQQTVNGTYKPAAKGWFIVAYQLAWIVIFGYYFLFVR